MKSQRNILADHRGSTLILIVICIAYITILCSFLLSMSLTNRKMKTIEQKAKDNFYSTETALDELKAGLEEVAAAALESAYVEVMEQFIEKSEEEKKQLLANYFIDGLEARLSTVSGYYMLDTIRDYLTNSSAGLETSEGENELIKTADHITLKNIKITYTDTEGYYTAISTDIVIFVPSTDIAETTSSPIYSEYGLIADHGIRLDSQPNVLVNGNLYAGNGGIYLNNASSLLISSRGNVITRGDIQVKERSSLEVLNYPVVWAKNITTLKEEFDTSEVTNIHIEGDCYVADDLTLSSKESQVTIEGDYYGYSYQSYTTPTPEYPLQATNSSAILINGKGSTLDLTGVRKLYLAGRAYLDPNYDGSATTDIFTGEALSVKAFQYAYLVPSECLWCGINPVPESVYLTLTPSDTEVDLGKSLTTPFPVTITDYADGFSKMIYNENGQKITYYYLKFKSEDHANRYVQKYFEYYQNGGGVGAVDIDKRIASNVEGIKLNPSFDSLITAGNLFAYQSEEGTELIQDSVDMALAAGGEKSNSLKAVEMVSKQLVKRYDSMVQSLAPVANRAPYDKESLFNSIIDKDKLLADIEGISKVILGENVVYLVDNKLGTPSEFEFVLEDDNSLPGNGRKGMIIATGGVTVSGNYEGLIIAGKDITLKAGAVVSASKRIIDDIIRANEARVNSYLRDYEDVAAGSGSSEDATINISDLIVYENWKKN